MSISNDFHHVTKYNKNGIMHLLMKPSKASIIPDRLAGRSPTGLLRDFSRSLHSVRNDKKVLTVISI